jgi:ABC-type nitrate/sulfonate/bicarbonate transport system permease component
VVPSYNAREEFTPFIRFQELIGRMFGTIRFDQFLWTLASFAVVFGAWEVAGRVPISLAFPPFSSVMAALWRLMLSGELLAAYAETLPPLLIGIALVSFGGLALGIAMGLSRSAEWLFYPLLVILQTAPIAAIIPLITFIYGIGMASKVLAVVIIAAPLVVLNCYRGIRHTSQSLLKMCRSFLGTRRQEITKVILPYASSMIFAGLRLGISGAFIGIVLAELLITPTGIGDIISYNRAVAKYPEMYAAILSIIALATIVLSILQRVEDRLFTRRDSVFE